MVRHDPSESLPTHRVDTTDYGSARGRVTRHWATTRLLLGEDISA
jgi:hypothetical protein